MGRMTGDTEDALTGAVWRVAGGNRRVWSKTAAVAENDVCVSQ